MKPEETNKTLEVAKAKCEWNAPLDYQGAFDVAISALQAQDVHGTNDGDTISRQDAIRIAEQGQIQGYQWQFEQLTKLSSAQPESTRTFVELVVEYPDPELCTYKEYKGRPYYSIKYIENGEKYVGYGTYKPEVLSQYLKEYFISSAQPNLQPTCNQLATGAISRQAAIDAVHEEFDDCLVWDESGKYTADEVEQILDRVPSVTPKPFHNIEMREVLAYIDRMPEDVWQEFTACLECRGWELTRRTAKWCGGEFA